MPAKASVTVGHMQKSFKGHMKPEYYQAILGVGQMGTGN